MAAHGKIGYFDCTINKLSFNLNQSCLDGLLNVVINLLLGVRIQTFAGFEIYIPILKRPGICFHGKKHINQAINIQFHPIHPFQPDYTIQRHAQQGGNP